ncbi:MAG: carboxylating nicotinate-nucleotide diphosphorylase [Rhodanobacter sp.]|nr:MAG: carboxylating nicotinate-nucleotide diphosphorylase [Rhodanobacter sp.]
MSDNACITGPSADQVAADIERAFTEDLGTGDVTAELLPLEAHAHAELTCRDNAVLAGSAWFDACFRRMDPQTRIEWFAQDGQRIAAGAIVCRLSGRARALVSAERPALNFLQLLSATATAAAAYVEAVAGTHVRLLDTRKTLPGLRLAQKYAVRCGGGRNQRMGLYDAILIKENHITAAGSLAAAVQLARRLHPSLPLEVEVENLEQLDEALEASPDRIMLDNFSLSLLGEAVRITAGRIPLEASGNVDLHSIGDMARTGVDYISVGALTKHVRAIDLSLRLHLR